VQAISQTITLEKAQELARKNYPSLKQQDIINKTSGLNISNLNKNYLPQFSINGQASYQSDVTKIDADLPGIKFDSPSKDQYKFTADINQVIFDGGATKQQKTLTTLSAAVENQQVEVELYNLKERVNDVYLSILYTDELIKQNDLIQKDLNTGLKRINAQVQYGVAFRSSANILKAELLKAGQRLIELQENRRALIETLSIYTNEKFNEQAVFEKPSVIAIAVSDITRPEIKLFSNQQALLEQQNKLITAKNLPKTSLFVQGGYGRPALNLLKNDFQTFYIAGVRFNWPLSGLYTKKNEREIVKLNQETVQSKRETFLLNTNAQLAAQKSEIDKLNKLVQSDNEIIDLRKEVTTAAKAQLENGVMTASDYLVEVNAEDQARQTLIAHELQLLQARIKYNTLRGE
jgi:outer membrane protein TolC